MLAALLLNLPEYQRNGDGKPQRYSYARRNAGRTIEDLAKLLEQPEVQKAVPVKPLVKLTKRLAKFEQEQETPLNEFNDLIRDLSMREFELKRSIEQSKQQQPYGLLILEYISVLLMFLQEIEEEVALVLLMED